MTTQRYSLILDVERDGTLASLFDPDEPGSLPIAEATGATADEAVAELMRTVTFDAE
jgi:hypothetical protein